MCIFNYLLITPIVTCNIWYTLAINSLFPFSCCHNYTVLSKSGKLTVFRHCKGSNEGFCKFCV